MRATVTLRVLFAALLGAVALSACSSGGDGDTDSGSDPPTTATTTTVADRSDAEPATTTVFRAGEDGYATFRIPAVVADADGGLIAFAEGRVGSAADDGNVDLVAKRSTDEGRSWGPLQVVADDGANFVGNPSPVLDRESGRVVVLATHKDGADSEVEILTGTGADTSRAWLLTSDDGGATWSAPDDITADVKQPTWGWYSVGPGHAFQLEHGPHAGRLVAPANHSDPTNGYGAHVLLSDDGGRTWRIGAVDSTGPTPVNPGESTGAELADGTIVFSSRDENGADEWNRLRTTSTDGGETFTGPYADQVGLVTPIVQASVLSADALGVEGALLLSAPAAPENREDLRIRASIDGGGTWNEGLVVHPGPAAYSDLVGLPGGAVGVLYEAGDQGQYERIDFTVVGVARITGG